ncbi:histidine kinase [Plantactinospora mayteni]|uniref:histidine kinase n=1 Tax=Plantactinospora mayteni TaxID=566021 RepID=A0ABQ4ERV6_9ACTN|nr:histidine kinase [Plantactinospora mayteni]GIG97379.1 two-component sensor histidine kinase [Plantactinospora mayteni]
MTLRAALAPLTSGATYRRGVFLLLGGVLLLPYLLLVTVFVDLLRADDVPRLAVLPLVVAAAVIAAVPLFLRGTRALEIAATRALLDVELPEPPADGGIDRETRLRCALWIGIHLVSGGLVGFALIVALPMALLFLFAQLGVSTGTLHDLQIGPLSDWHRGWLNLVGVGLLVLLGYAVAGLGALARLMAPVLLGPSQTERIAALERQANQLAERNRLARELHDSVGHALTVATLQAAAAGELLETDREFVRRALRAIEETGRAAMADLDHVLGLLRQGDADRSGDGGRPGNNGGAGGGDDGPAARAPQRTLDELDRLVADTRATGLAVSVELAGDLGAVPAVVAREGYRIVQEGLTNAARHAGRRPVTLRVAARPDALEIELVNALGEPSGAVRGRPGPVRPPGQRQGRGLAGIRERVVLLGGRVSAGPEDGNWRVAVRLPTTVAEPPAAAAGERQGMERI